MKPKGPAPKIDEETANKIRALRSEGLSYDQIAEQLGYTYNQVWRVINYRRVQSYSPYYKEGNNDGTEKN